jgi:hypothetical protein
MSVHFTKIKLCWPRSLRAVQRSGFDRFQPTGGRFVASGSCFAVYRKPIEKKIAGKGENNFPKLVLVQNLTGSWNVAFDPAWGGPTNAEFPELISWTQRSEEGIKYYSGTAIYRTTFDLTDEAGTAKEGDRKTKKLFPDLGNVKEVAEVRLNGKKLGILWCNPWRVEITKAVKPTGNVLEVDVINLWANRVIGDLNMPKEERLTKTHAAFRFDMLTKTTTPIDSGLLGPVTLQRDEE